MLHLVCALALTLSVQDPGREVGFGIVRDASGSPWVGATVRLEYRAHKDVTDPKTVDVVTVQTDSRGKFRVQLLPDVCYVAYATEAVGDGDGLRWSEVMDGAKPNAPILLREAGEGARARVHLELDESWDGHDVAWYAVRSPEAPLPMRERLTPDEEGMLTVPAWPQEGIFLEAWSAGWVVYRSLVPLKPGEVAEVELELRQVRDLVFLDAATKAPIANVELVAEAERLVPGEGRPRSDAEGRVQLVHPSDRSKWTARGGRYVAHVDGYCEGWIDWVQGSSDDESPVEWLLHAADTVSGQVMISADEPLAHAVVLLEGAIGQDESFLFGVQARSFRTDAEGRVSLCGRVDQHAYQLTVPLSAAVREQLHGPDPRAARIAPVALLRVPSAKNPADLGTMQLDALQPITVTVIGVGTQSVEGLEVLIRPMGSLGLLSTPHQPLRLRTDRRGRVRVLVDPALPLLVRTITPEGAAWTVLEQGDRAARLEIDPRHVVRLRVLDGLGKPVSESWVTCWIAESEDSDVRADVFRELVRYDSPGAFGQSFWRTDEQGVVTFVTPALGVTLNVSVGVRGVNVRELLYIPTRGFGRRIDFMVGKRGVR